MSAFRSIPTLFILVLFLFPSLGFAEETRNADVEKRLQEREWFEKGERHFLNNEYDDALEAFTSAISFNRNEGEYFTYRATAFISKGQYDKAIEDLDKAIALNPDYNQPYIARGLCYFMMGRYDNAIEDYSKAINLDPENSLVYISRGFAFRRKDQHDRAIVDLQRACDLGYKPGCEDLKELYETTAAKTSAGNNEAGDCVRKGIKFLRNKQFDRAIEEFTTAIKLQPEEVLAYHKRGVAYRKKAEYEKSIEDFSAAIAINPNIAAIYYSRGVAYNKQGQMEKARADFKVACDLGDEDGCKEVRNLSAKKQPILRIY